MSWVEYPFFNLGLLKERYREKNVETKRKVEEAKRMSNFKWGQDFDRSYQENKKKFWKEVRRVRR